MHRVAVFAMTGVETVRVAATRGLAELRDRYVIGHWPWKLPACPRAWEGAFDLVAGIWPPTRSVPACFAGRAPVRSVVWPPRVELPADRCWVRTDSGLPGQAFLFLFTSDFLPSPSPNN